MLATDRSRLAAVVVAVALIAAAVTPGSASAGRLVVSGHDIDHHCDSPDSGTTQPGECHFLRVVLTYVRNGAPDPSKPVLVLDRPGTNVNQMQRAIDLAFGGAGVLPMEVVDPRSAQFAATPIDTAHFSAVAVASDVTCGGCDLNMNPTGAAPPYTASTPDSDAINARTADLRRFFDAGGGILTGAGAVNGGATFFGLGGPQEFLDNNYYDFISAPGGTQRVTPPLTLSPLGKAAGITDGTDGTADDINCCGTHNSFDAVPAGSQLRVVEVDAAGRAVTLLEDTNPPTTTIVSGPPAETTSPSAAFMFQSSEDGTTFQCRLDADPFVDCASPVTFLGLSAGRHQVAVRAVDLVGNVDPSPPVYGWSVCLDRDGDGATDCETPPDCDDNSFATHPGATEIAGNKRDENCDGILEPFPRVGSRISASFLFNRRYTTVARLTMLRVPPKAKAISVRCTGRGCKFKTKTVKRKRSSVALVKLFRSAHLRPGARIEIRVSVPGEISDAFRYTVRRQSDPRFQQFCVSPRSPKLAKTCADFV